MKSIRLLSLILAAETASLTAQVLPPAIPPPKVVPESVRTMLDPPKPMDFELQAKIDPYITKIDFDEFSVGRKIMIKTPSVLDDLEISTGVFWHIKMTQRPTFVLAFARRGSRLRWSESATVILLIDGKINAIKGSYTTKRLSAFGDPAFHSETILLSLDEAQTIALCQAKVIKTRFKPAQDYEWKPRNQDALKTVVSAWAAYGGDTVALKKRNGL
jgi:hypothetical protein